MTRYFRDYLKYYFKYLVYQIHRYILYNLIQLIYNFSIFFHILIINFIFIISFISKSLDYIIFVIYKFNNKKNRIKKNYMKNDAMSCYFIKIIVIKRLKFIKNDNFRQKFEIFI